MCKNSAIHQLRRQTSQNHFAQKYVKIVPICCARCIATRLSHCTCKLARLTLSWTLSSEAAVVVGGAADAAAAALAAVLDVQALLPHAAVLHPT